MTLNPGILIDENDRKIGQCFSFFVYYPASLNLEVLLARGDTFWKILGRSAIHESQTRIRVGSSSAILCCLRISGCYVFHFRFSPIILS